MHFNAVKALWNYLHDIKIKDHEVEVYVQNETEPGSGRGRDIWFRHGDVPDQCARA